MPRRSSKKPALSSKSSNFLTSTNQKGGLEMAAFFGLIPYPELRTKWIIIWIGAGPYTGRFSQIIAFHATGATVRQHPRRVRQLIHRIKHFSFQCNFTHDMFAITYLAGFPCTISHTTPPKQQLIGNSQRANLYIQSKTSGPGYPVTGITNKYDNSRNLDSKSP